MLSLDAALNVYVERGYQGTSMQAVADAAGATKPVGNECFPNKDEFLLALFDREERRLLDERAREMIVRQMREPVRL
jgi:AcrR family transcriptional regulator